MARIGEGKLFFCTEEFQILGDLTQGDFQAQKLGKSLRRSGMPTRWKFTLF